MGKVHRRACDVFWVCCIVVSLSVTSSDANNVISSEGNGCSSKSSCDWSAEWALAGSKWNGTLLSYDASQTGKQLSDCCSLCQDQPACLFYDYNSATQSCNLYDVSPFFNPYGLLEDESYTASFIDRKAVQDRSWATTGILSATAGDTVSARGYSGCATSCISACNCSFWSSDSSNSHLPCTIYQTPQGLDGTVYDNSIYPVLTPNAGGAAGAEFGVQFSADVGGSLDTKPVRIDWENARLIEESTVRQENLSVSMPSIMDGGTFDTMQLPFWYNWVIDTPGFSNNARRLYITMDDFASLHDTIAHDILNTSFANLVFPLQSNSTDMFTHQCTIKCNESFTTTQHSRVSFDAVMHKIELDFEVDLSLSTYTQCTQNSGTTTAAAAVDSVAQCMDQVTQMYNNPLYDVSYEEFEQLKSECQKLNPSGGGRRRTLLQSSSSNGLKDILEDLFPAPSSSPPAESSSSPPAGAPTPSVSAPRATQSVGEIQEVINSLVPLERLADREGICDVDMESGAVKVVSGAVVGSQRGVVRLQGKLVMVLPVRVLQVNVQTPTPGTCFPSDPCSRGGHSNTYLERAWSLPADDIHKYQTGPPEFLSGMPDALHCCQYCKSRDNCMFINYQRTTLRCSFYSYDAIPLAFGEDVSTYLADNLDSTAAFLDERTFDDSQWQGSFQWNSFLDSMPGFDNREGSSFCSAMCQKQCGCNRWSFDRSSSECRLFPYSVVSQSGVSSLAVEQGWISGLKLGPSLTFSLQRMALDWSEANVTRDEYLWSQSADRCNAYRSGTKELQQVTYMLNYTWEMHQMLFSGLWEDLVPLDFGDEFRSLDFAKNSPLLDSYIPVKAPWDLTVFNSSTGTSVTIPKVSIPPLGRTLINTTLRLVDVTVPFRANFTVRECVLKEVKDPNSLLLGQKLTLRDLLLRGGFCGTMYSADEASVEAVVEVQGKITLTGVPVGIWDVKSKDIKTEGTEVLVGYMLPGTVYNTSDCKYAANWGECHDVCVEDPLCVGWSWLVDKDLRKFDPEWDTCGSSSCLIKYRISSEVAKEGVVSGLVPPPGVTDAAPPCSLLPDTLILTAGGAPLNNAVSSTSSSFQCCRMCTQTQGCIAFAYNYTGSCQLLTGAIVGATPMQGVVGGVATQKAGCQPTVVQLPAGSSLSSALQQQSIDMSWQEVCCFNGLSNCHAVPNDTTLLLPCSRQRLTSSCPGVNATQTAATTVNSCRCKAQYNATLNSRLYGSSGGCLDTRVQQEVLPWCYVDVSSPGCNEDGLPRDEVGYWATCRETGTDVAQVQSDSNANNSSRGPAVGCDLMFGVSLSSSLGSINRGNATSVSDAGQCCQLCQITPTCAAFTFITDSSDGGGHCWLMNGISRAIRRGNAVSGVNKMTQAAPEGNRRRLLQSSPSSSSCPTVYVTSAGESLRSLPPHLTGGLSAEQICCFNSLDSCDVQYDSTALLIPCVDAPSSCPAVNQQVVTQTVGSDNTLAITLAVAFSCAIAFLIAGLAASFLFFTRTKGMSRMLSKRLPRRAGFESDSLLGSVDGVDDPGRNLTDSPALQGDTYKAESITIKGDGNAIVMLAEESGSHRPVALKFFPTVAAYYHQKEFHTSQRSTLHLPLVYAYHDPDVGCGWPAIAMERGDYSLQQWMNRKSRRVSDVTRQAVLRDILEAVAALHQSGVVHGNICPANLVWFGAAHRWKLVGFQNWSHVGDTQLVGGSNVRYQAPEVATAKEANRKLPSATASDMWSVGVVMWELCLNDQLFGVEYSQQEVTGMLTGDLPLPFQQYRALWTAIGDPKIRDLLQSLLSLEPALRKSADEVLSSDIFDTAWDAEMQEQLMRLLDKSVDTLGRQVTELQELQLQVLHNTTTSALVVCITLEEISEQEPKEDPLDGMDAEVFDDAESGGWEDLLSTAHSFHTAAAFSHSGPRAYSRTGSQAFSRSGSVAFSRSGSAVLTRNGSSLFRRNDTAAVVIPAAAVEPEDMDMLHVYGGYLHGKYSTHEAPITLSSQVGTGDSSPTFMVHSHSIYAIRFRVLYGADEAGDVPIQSLDAVYIGDHDSLVPEVTLPCQAIEDACDTHVWEGFCIWNTGEIKSGKVDLSIDMLFKLKANGMPLSLKKSLSLDVYPPSTSLAVQRAVPKLRDMWNNAPDWLKLTAKGVSIFYSMNMK